ncbi:extracellular solute-binding protein [uncultured Sneathiella sp.]|uniref:extracellular solute-binding protein n=1 Tax=uncultured Sneathiella sp. TaxID=879315 RepID=UPI0030EC6F66|tara:strand:- start:19101 stop:20882 length:1782 start_codon:yes stop_codon:yes gene_type:complete
MRQLLLFLLLALVFSIVMEDRLSAEEQHAIAMHGDPKYAAGFPHFDYVNPEAPVGETLRLSAIGSFDSVNPFLLKGVSPRGIGDVYQSLLSRSRDEPFTLYADIARSIDVATDRSWIVFHIDPRAHFSNGQEITVEDVLASFEALRDEGRPNVQSYYRKVTKAEILGTQTIRFEFEKEGRYEMPLIIGLMSVLPKSTVTNPDFTKSSLSPIPGSGPYLIEKVEAGRRIVYRRDDNFWGWHLPQYKGRFNFERIIYDYFRDDDVALEAFKSHNIDARFEQSAAKWANAYDTSDPGTGFQKAAPKLQIPAPMLAFVFNTRQEKFSNLRVRQALTLAFDFEWVNANILYGLYQRTESFFENSPLAANGPITETERDLLSPFKTELPEAVFNDAFHLPQTDGSGRSRENLRRAQELLFEAGYIIDAGILRREKTDKAFTVEFLVNNSEYIKLIAPFQRNLETLGIRSTIRQVDTASYQNRATNYDFDMIINSWGQSLSPGNEQAFYWSRDAADTPGTRNYPGIRLASIDMLIEKIATATSHDALVTATRALDRVLLNGYYVIPLYFTERQWLAHWPDIKLPETPSFWGTSPDLWWHE